MFEKESEDNKPPYACCSFNTNCELWKDGFQKGAEFGYNKCFEQIRKIVNEDTRLDCIIPELLRLKETI